MKNIHNGEIQKIFEFLIQTEQHRADALAEILDGPLKSCINGSIAIREISTRPV